MDHVHEKRTVDNDTSDILEHAIARFCCPLFGEKRTLDYIKSMPRAKVKDIHETLYSWIERILSMSDKDEHKIIQWEIKCVGDPFMPNLLLNGPPLVHLPGNDLIELLDRVMDDYTTPRVEMWKFLHNATFKYPIEKKPKTRTAHM
jgi:hypothetical protein